MLWKPANNREPKSLKSTSKTTCLKVGLERRPMPEKRFFRLIRNIPETDPANPERPNLSGYLVGHRGESQRRNGRPQSGEEGSAQTQTQIRKPFRIRS